MYTSVTDILKWNNHMRKTVLSYLLAVLFCVLFDRVYMIFGHGVYSASMSLMFLYPLSGGIVLFLLRRLLLPGADIRRLFYNCYNSGVASFTVGSAIRGILEIAGTSSPYTVCFIILGIIFYIAGLSGFIVEIIRKR